MVAGNAAGSARHDRDEARTYGEVIRAGQVCLDLGRLAADTGHGPVPLTRLEFLLLRELAEHPGQPVPKSKLLAAVWGYDFDPGSNVVDVCVQRLRSKLGFDLIKTVRGEGYQLAGQLPSLLVGRTAVERFADYWPKQEAQLKLIARPRVRRARSSRPTVVASRFVGGAPWRSSDSTAQRRSCADTTAKDCEPHASRRARARCI